MRFVCWLGALIITEIKYFIRMSDGSRYTSFIFPFSVQKSLRLHA